MKYLDKLNKKKKIHDDIIWEIGLYLTDPIKYPFTKLSKKAQQLLKELLEQTV